MNAPSPFTTRPEISGRFGVVTSTHWLATAAGMSILEQGGNAFDAAIATGTSLHVVEPHQNGPAGETPLIFHSVDQGGGKVICGQGVAPQAATPEAFTSLGLDVVPGSGLLPAVVPGSFGAWMLLLAEYGTMTVREVLTPAIGYARRGFQLVYNIPTIVGNMAEMFLNEWPSSAAVYMPGGKPPDLNKPFKRPALADTFERIIREAEAVGGNREQQIEAARRCFYEGFVAETIDNFCRDNELMDTSGECHRGLLTGDDMAKWRATIEDPLSYDYGDYTVYKTGPWAQGPVFLQHLALLKSFDLGKMGPNSAEFIHTVIECGKLAFADRDAFYGDPDFVDVPLDVLLSDAYNDERRALVGHDASFELRPGNVPGYSNEIVTRLKGTTDIAHGESLDFAYPQPEIYEGDTTHFDIIDHHGNMISGTPSGTSLHTTPVVEGLGFGLTARGQMYWLKEGLPGTIAPGKRPRTTLTPTLALRDGKPYMAFGTPGGDHQDQWSMGMFLRHVHFGLDLQAANDAPAFHTNHLASSFFPRECDLGSLSVEGRLDKSAYDDLKRRGHRLEVYGDYDLGYVTAATVENGLLRAGASPRGGHCYATGR